MREKMSYLLFTDLNGGEGRRKIEKYLRGTAKPVQRSIWEFQKLSDLFAASKLVRDKGGRTLAFFKSDEILLHASDVECLLKKFR